MTTRKKSMVAATTQPRTTHSIEELDMSATAMRIRDAGGEQFLENIMVGVERIMGGDTNLSGLSLAMETTTTEDA